MRSGFEHYLVGMVLKIILLSRSVQLFYLFPLYETTELLDWQTATTILSKLLSAPQAGLNPISPSSRTELLNSKIVLRSVQNLNHILSHQHIQARFFTVLIPESVEALPAEWSKIELNEIDKLAVSRLTEIYLENHMNELDFNSSSDIC
jgi:hypothetical protein